MQLDEMCNSWRRWQRELDRVADPAEAKLTSADLPKPVRRHVEKVAEDMLALKAYVRKALHKARPSRHGS